MCVGFTAANSGSAFTDAYFYLAEEFDMCALEGTSPAGMASCCAKVLALFVRHIAKRYKVPLLRGSLPVISELIIQSVVIFIESDPDLHPIYLGEGVWRLFTHVEAFQADEGVMLETG